MNSSPLLLPQPKQFRILPGKCHLPHSGTIGSNTPDAPHVRRFAAALESLLGGTWRIQSLQKINGIVDIQLLKDGSGCGESGTMVIGSEGKILLQSPGGAGLQHLCTTLLQLLRACGNPIPACTVRDEPAIARRGYMLDISRDRVPTMRQLRSLVSQLAEWKINELQLYTEHTFAYRNHETVWVSASPLTAADISEIDRLCREYHIDLVPNQNTFGHFERWLAHPEYLPLAEAPNGFLYPWGSRSDRPSCLNPSDPASARLVRDLLAELLPNFSSRFVNVGCDETWELGQGKSKARCEKLGTGRVYLDYLLTIHKMVRSNKKDMQFWGDIVLHHPELIHELPDHTVALNWGYNAKHPFQSSSEKFAAANIPFYVCPGTSGWLSIAGQSSNAFANLANAATAGVNTGALGFLVTDWGDGGHWQPPAVSILPLAFGAACAWTGNPPSQTDFFATADLHIFQSRNPGFSSAVFELGDLHTPFQIEGKSNHVLFDLLRWGRSKEGAAKHPASKIKAARKKLQSLRERLTNASLGCADSALVVEEFTHCTNLMDFALSLASQTPMDRQCALAARRLVAEQTHLWLLRSRPGGLTDSLPKMRALAELASPGPGSLV